MSVNFVRLDVREKWVALMRPDDVLAGKEVKLGMLLISEAERILKIAEEMEERANKMYQAEMLSNQLAAVRVYL